MNKTQKVLFGHEVAEIRDATFADIVIPTGDLFTSASVCRAQQHIRFTLGIEEAELVPTIYGWSLRYASGLDNNAIIYSSIRYGGKSTKEAALNAAREWQLDDRDHRIVYDSRFQPFEEQG